jgi:hypothetical protein
VIAHKLKPEETLYVRSMGKALRVLAVFDNDAAANAYMEKHDEAAVVACFGPLILLADKHDHGTKIP